MTTNIHTGVEGLTHIHLDCSSGLAGDMLMAALIDLGADVDRICAALQRAGLEKPAIQVSRIRRGGIQALHVDVPLAEEGLDESEEPHHDHHHHGHSDHGHSEHGHSEHGHSEHGHHGHHGHQHRTYAQIRAHLLDMDLPQRVRAHAQSALRRLAEAEAKVHGMPVDEVHFHEVGAIDTIADIIGVCVAMDDLGCPTVSASAVATGTGTIRVAHGLLPVPAPATMELLKGVPIWSGDVEAELTTPTGAALLTEFCSSYGPMPAMKVSRVGLGAGTRELEDRPNVLRALLGERLDEQERNLARSQSPYQPVPKYAPLPDSDSLLEIKANIDDMPAELLADLTEKLLAAGALDAWTTPIIMKKGRPGHVVSLLCRPDELDLFAGLLLEGSTTFGLRWSHVQRLRLPRKTTRVDTVWGPVDVMVALRDGQVWRASPEFDSCRRLAHESNQDVLTVYRQALAACLAIEASDPQDGLPTQKRNDIAGNE